MGWQEFEKAKGLRCAANWMSGCKEKARYSGPWGYRHWGEGLTGRGEYSPLPCLYLIMRYP